MALIYCEEICSLNFPDIRSFIPTLVTQLLLSDYMDRQFPAAGLAARCHCQRPLGIIVWPSGIPLLRTTV